MCANAEADPADVRYALIAEPGACEYCRMLDSRGYVYHSGRTAGSSCHEHCNCSIAVGFDGPGVSGSYEDAIDRAHEWQASEEGAPAVDAAGLSVVVSTFGDKVTLDKRQVGKKTGKHARDYGLDPGKKEDREWFLSIIMEAIRRPDEEPVDVEWRGQQNPCRAFVRGGDAVIVDANGAFVTMLKGGADGNERVRRAREHRGQGPRGRR